MFHDPLFSWVLLGTITIVWWWAWLARSYHREVRQEQMRLLEEEREFLAGVAYRQMKEVKRDGNARPQDREVLEESEEGAQ